MKKVIKSFVSYFIVFVLIIAWAAGLTLGSYWVVTELPFAWNVLASIAWVGFLLAFAACALTND